MTSSAAFAEIVADFKKFQDCMLNNASDTALCKKNLSAVKIGLTQLPLLPSMIQSSSSMTTEVQQLHIARETYELASLLSVRDEDVEAFERHIALTKTFYSDYSDFLPPSQRKNLILGLNLLHLLSMNRMSEFHSELELIPLELHEDLFIKHPVEVEQCLIEGSYSKLENFLPPQVPATEYEYFMEILMETVREEIADCCERAYKTLDLTSLQRMLMHKSPEDTTAFIEEREAWILKDNTISFNLDAGTEVQIPAESLIKQSLEYAIELERIV